MIGFFFNLYFIFNLLNLWYSDYNVFLPFLLNFFIFWLFFFKVIFYFVYGNLLLSDQMKVKNINRFAHYSFFIKINLFLMLFFILFFVTFRGEIDYFWWNHFKFSNFTFDIIILLLLVNFLFVFILGIIKYNFNIGKFDYFFALLNLANFLPLMFLVNTFFTFFFVLEVNSCLIFYKFVVSKIWYNGSKSDSFNNYLSLKRLLPKNYLNMLFFQYWAAFFSSVMITFVLIFFMYLYGTTEWFILNIFNKMSMKYYMLNFFFNNIIVCSVILFAFLIKIGFTPVQLYKIEIYKGIPYISIFFYTTYYFLAFFLFFVLLLTFYLNSYLIYWWGLLLFILCVGGIYVLSLLFDVNYIKSFFAYSSVVNSLGFITLVSAMLI